MTSPTDTSAALPVRLDLAGVVLNGDLSLSSDARGLVVFAHGSGSSWHSSRNWAVAKVLQHGRLGTLLLDTLTEKEDLARRTYSRNTALWIRHRNWQLNGSNGISADVRS